MLFYIVKHHANGPFSKQTPTKELSKINLGPPVKISKTPPRIIFCTPFRIKYGRQLVFDCAILHQVWSLVGVCLCHLHQVWSSGGVCLNFSVSGMVINWCAFEPSCIRYGRQFMCAGAVCIRYGRQLACVCAILHQVWSSFGIFVPFASGMIGSWRMPLPFCILFYQNSSCMAQHSNIVLTCSPEGQS